MPSHVDTAIASGTWSTVEQPDLLAGLIRLRPWADDDARELVAAYDEPEIQRWHARSMTAGEAQQWISEARSVWAEEKGASWAVDIDGQLVGRMTLKFDLPDARAGVGYWTRREHRGRGIAPHALVAATRWAFDQGFHRVELEHSTQNPASCRVAVKAQFLAEGTRRSSALHADGWHDMHVHGCVAEPAVD